MLAKPPSVEPVDILGMKNKPADVFAFGKPGAKTYLHQPAWPSPVNSRPCRNGHT
jgi:hypothetical protein